MSLTSVLARGKGRYQRTAAITLARRPLKMNNRVPLISFTFDDFPRSALSIGGRILEEQGAAGTYYTSLGLMGQRAPTGEMFTRGDLSDVLQRGHELGCHTFAHCHAYDTPADAFEDSILENRRVLKSYAPEADFKTLSYPISCPRPGTKKRCAKYFAGCRGGGQTFNKETIDLDLLSAFFLEQSRDDPDSVYRLIDENALKNGWLIFGSHDIQDHPTRFGCEPPFFREVVRRAVKSGAIILPVAQALQLIRGTNE